MTDKRIRRGTIDSVAKFEEAINAYTDSHNENPKAFVWTAGGENSLAAKND